MSNYLKIFVSTYVVIILLGLFNTVVDPYGLFDEKKIAGISWPKPEMVKSVKLHKSYKVAQYKPEAVVLGTSRSAFGIDPDHPAWGDDLDPRYNLSLSGANMYVTRRFLEHAHILHPLKQVVLGLDFFTFNVHRQQAPDYRGDFLVVNDDGSSNRYFDTKILAAALLSTDAIQGSYTTLLAKNKHPLVINENGMFDGPVWKNNLKKSFSNMENLYLKYVYLAGGKREYAFVRPDTGVSSLEEFRQFVNYCKEHQIDLKLFISPPHARHQEIIKVLGMWPLFEQWKRELVHVLQEVKGGASLWDFSGYNSITTVDISLNEDHYYRDSTHYHSAVGDLILSRLFHYKEDNVPADFGRELTMENIEENLLAIRAEQEKFQLDYPADVEDIEAIAEEFGFDRQDLILRMDGRHSKARWFREASRETPVSKALRDFERGMSLDKLYVKHGITDETFSSWQKLYDHSM